MTLPASGSSISMSQINTELGRSSTATISLDDAESGVYATINTASPSYPNNARPAAMSEWYSYNHSASASLSFTMYTGGSYNESNQACTASPNDNQTLYFGSGSGSACPVTNDVVYTDVTQSTAFNGGDAWWYSKMCDKAYYITTNGSIEGEVIECGNFWVGLVSEDQGGDAIDACNLSVPNTVYKNGNSSAPVANDYLYANSALSQPYQFNQYGTYYNYKDSSGTYYAIYVAQTGGGDTIIESVTSC